MPRRGVFFRLVHAFLFFFALIAFAGVIEKEVTFNSNDISFTEIKGYDFMRFRGCRSNTIEIGAPCLPRAAFPVLIPQGAEVIDVELISFDKEEISGEYEVYPTQPPRPILKDRVFTFIDPDEDIYAQDTPYPGKIIESGHTGSMGGYRLANVLIYPLHYIPSEKKLVLYSRIKFKITYEEKLLPLKTKTEKQNKIFKERVKNLILNPEDIGMFEPHTQLRGWATTDSAEYVIITVDSFATTFQELADWKTKKGVPAKVVTLDYIYANYTGADNAERVRNFIKDANSSWGTIWVLLGGQCDYEWGQEIVPRRDVWYREEGEEESDNDTIPSDLYFSDLDGDWNADGDGTYGEFTDDVDLYSDVFVGRAPARTIAQAETFVNKVLTYEKTPPLGYQKKILLPVSVLFDNYDETFSQEAIADMVPSDWQVSRLYERDGNLSHDIFVDSLRSGFGFAHLMGHGWAGGVAGTLCSDDLDTLGNDGLLGIHNANGCFTGAIDYVPNGDCFAEHYLTSTTGGGFSIMNSRVGIASVPGALSEGLDTCFYHEIFKEGYPYHNYLGVAHAFSKDGYVSEVTWWDVWAWCIYELNLFGDPELPLWTDIPEELIVTHYPVIPVDAETFTVNVTDGISNVQNALVCLYEEGEVYERGYTDVFGNITLSLSPLTSTGTMYCTVTKHDYLPYEGSVDVISTSDPWVVFECYTMTDVSGDSDGKVDPGESIELELTVRNVCHDTAWDVTGILRTADSYVTITDSTDEFGDILPDLLSENLENFDFDVAVGCPADNVINFELVARDRDGLNWVSSFSIPVKTPDITLSTDTLNYGTVFTGYTGTLEFLTKNDGRDVLIVNNITSDNGNYSVDITDFSLAPDESQIVKVVFEPTSAGVSTGNLTIQSNDLNEPTLTVFLQGEGLVPPNISVSPDYFRDSLYTGGTATHALTIYNTGLSDLCLQMNTVSKGYSTYALTLPKTNPEVSDSTESTNTNLPIRTSQIQAFLADLTNVRILYDISHEQFPSNYWSTIIADLSLRGGTVVENSSSITSGLLSEYDVLWITDFIYYSYFSSSEIAAVRNWVLSGGALLLEGDETWRTMDAYNDLLSALGAGIEYSTDDGSDGITNNIYPHETTVDVDEIYLSFSFAHLSTVTTPASHLINDVDDVPNTAYSIVGRGKVFAMADELFSGTHIGYADNQLFANQVFDWLASGADWLYLIPGCATVPAGENVLVDVVFDAAGLNGGEYFADIIIASNDPDEPEVRVPTYLHVTAATDIVVSSDTLDYGVVFYSSPVTDTLIVSNGGIDLLTVNGISSNNPVYTVDVNNFTLDPGEEQEVLVTFTPSSMEIFAGTLTITSDDPDEPTLIVYLQGEWGEPPDISVSPEALSDTLSIGEISVDSLTIYNTGQGDLSFNIAIDMGTSLLRELASPEMFFDDFEDGDYDGWLDAVVGSGIKEVTSATAANGTIYSYHESSSPEGHFDGIYQVFDSIRPGYISFYIRSGSTTTDDAYFVLQNSMNEVILWFYANNKGYLGVNEYSGGDATYAYTAETWYHIEFKNIDFSTQTFDYYVNEELIKANIPFLTSSDVEGYSRVDIYNFDSGSEAWWDEIFIADMFWWIGIDDISGTIPSGDSAKIEVTFSGTGLDVGDHYADIVVSSNDPDEPEVRVAAHLHLLPAGIVEKEIPEVFSVNQNYPNPFSSQTVIRYGCPGKAKVCIQVFDIMGRMVKTLANKEVEAGYHEVKWDGSNKFGRKIANAVYFYRIQAGDFTATKKMIFLQ